MATIPGVLVRYDVSPRVIIVPLPLTEIAIQDLHDTCTDISDDPVNTSYDRLIESAGKEDLGGTSAVGITATLQNARLAFAQRVVNLSTGTVTTPDTNGITLTDSGATFITDGVEPGDLVSNDTDSSVGTIIKVISETQVQLMDPLMGGTDDQFDSADAYIIFDWVQCTVSGGNLVAIDDLGGSIPEIFETFGTSVSSAKSSSATLIDGSLNSGFR